MAVQAFLRWFVVVRIHAEAGGRADFFGGLVQLDCLAGGVGAGAADDGHSAGGELDRQLDDTDVLFDVEGWRFAGGADGNQAVDAAANLKFDLLPQSIFIDFALTEGGDHCCECAAEHGDDCRQPGRLDKTEGGQIALDRVCEAKFQCVADQGVADRNLG